MKTFKLMTVVGVLASAAGAQSIDTSALLLRGSRAEGTFSLPAARLLEPGAWEVSLGYAHEGEVVRATTATGAVRGGALTQPVRWIDQRDLGWVQLSVSPLARFELNASLPVLLGQSVNAVAGMDTPLSALATSVKSANQSLVNLIVLLSYGAGIDEAAGEAAL